MEWANGRGGRTCDVFPFAVLVKDNEAGDTDGADAGWIVTIKKGWKGMKRRKGGEAYVRPTVKIPVRTSFCG